MPNASSIWMSLNALLQPSNMIVLRRKSRLPGYPTNSSTFSSLAWRAIPPPWPSDNTRPACCAPPLACPSWRRFLPTSNAADALGTNRARPSPPAADLTMLDRHAAGTHTSGPPPLAAGDAWQLRHSDHVVDSDAASTPAAHSSELQHQEDDRLCENLVLLPREPLEGRDRRTGSSSRRLDAAGGVPYRHPRTGLYRASVHPGPGFLGAPTHPQAPTQRAVARGMSRG